MLRNRNKHATQRRGLFPMGEYFAMLTGKDSLPLKRMPPGNADGQMDWRRHWAPADITTWRLGLRWRRALRPASTLVLSLLMIAGTAQGDSNHPSISANGPNKAIADSLRKDTLREGLAPIVNFDIRVNGRQNLVPLQAKYQAGPGAAQIIQRTEQAAKALALEKPGAKVTRSRLTGGAEVVRSTRGALSAPSGADAEAIARSFIADRPALYGLTQLQAAENLRFKGESVSRGSGLRMARFEQQINGVPVFQSDTRVLIDSQGRVVRTVGRLVPGVDPAQVAPALSGAASAKRALVAAMASVGIELTTDQITQMAETASALEPGKIGLVAPDSEILGTVESWPVYFPLGGSVLVPAWAQVAFTSGSGDYYTVTSEDGALLYRKNIRNHASTKEARFSVYVQADGETPADSPAPASPNNVDPGDGTQFSAINRIIVKMSDVQSLVASPNGWIPDSGQTTTGNNVNAYLDTDNDDLAGDPGEPLTNGHPVGNPDANGNNRDFLGNAPRDFVYTPAPAGGNPDAGNNPANADFQRGAVTQLFYLSNWYHDRLYALGFDEAAGNFQSNNFGLGGAGGDPVLAEAQDGSGTNNANFATPPDGISGQMQMFLFTGPSPDRDGSLDADVVFHELTHGLSSRLIGNGAGLNWAPGLGMGEGWSDFYALSLLNGTASDNPNSQYAAGAYATYKFSSPAFQDNYVYGIRRFPYSTDNTVNPLTWADVDDITVDMSGGISPSPVGQQSAGAAEVHNIGEAWALTLWEARSRIIADNGGNVPAGNEIMLQLVTDALKFTPTDPSFTEARDAILDTDCTTNGCANEESIWDGFADRGLGYGAEASLGVAIHMGVKESFSVPYLDYASVTIDDSAGNNNGHIDPGETVEVTVSLFNPWRGTTKASGSVTGTFSTATAGVTISDPTANWSSIAPQATVAAGDSFRFTVPAGASAGQALEFSLETASALGTTSTEFTLRVGTPSGTGAPITYTAIPGGLPIPDGDPTGTVDTLAISDDLVIADLDVRIGDLQHPWVGDLTFEVKGPSGLGIDVLYLLAGNGFVSLGFSNCSLGLNDSDNFLDTVFDDEAAAPNDLLVADCGSGNSSPGHGGDWLSILNSSGWGGAQDSVGQLSNFDGTSAKGTWTAFISDLASAASTPIGPAAGSGELYEWSLIITPQAFDVDPVTVITAVKGVSGPFKVGDTATYTVVLNNSGTAAQVNDPASDEFTDMVPTTLAVTSVSATSGVAAHTGNFVTWNGTIPAGDEVTITIEATIDTGQQGATVSNQGVVHYDGNVDGTSDTSGTTDNPDTRAADDPAAFPVGCLLAKADRLLTTNSTPGTAVYKACNSITAGTNFVVSPSDDVTFRVGSEIALEGGFVVRTGGTFSAEITEP